jgi:hypothetical protein
MLGKFTGREGLRNQELRIFRFYYGTRHDRLGKNVVYEWMRGMLFGDVNHINKRGNNSYAMVT